MQVLTSVLVLGLCFAVFVASHISDYKQRKAESMVSLAQVVGSSAVSAIQFQDNEAAMETLSDLKKVSPDVLNAAILDKNNSVFASYVKPGQDTFSFQITPTGNKKIEYTPQYLFVYNSIIDKGEVLGTVCLQIELKELAKIKAKQYEIAIIILVVGVGLAFLISFIVQSYISRRLLNLVKIMKQVGDTGDYTRHANAEGNDEISTLSHVFNNLMDQVRLSQEKKDEFIGIASHELKTPLTSIKGYLQVLDGIEDKQPNKKYIQKTLGSVNRLQDLIFDLLDVSKIQSGQLHLKLTDFDIDALVDETIASFQVIAMDHEIVRKGKQKMVTVSADRQRIEQVLINLLSNAVKYSPNARKVYVYAEKTGPEYIIKVQDFGIGIAKDEQPRVFDRFYRAKDNSVLISGFGLGLYICKDIMKNHGGKIWIKSDGNGTTFNVSLPVEPGALTKK